MRARCRDAFSTPWLQVRLPTNTLASIAAEAIVSPSTGDGRNLHTLWRAGPAHGLSVGINSLRTAVDARGRARRCAPDRLRQYRRHQCAAYGAPGPGGGNLGAR